MLLRRPPGNLEEIHTSQGLKTNSVTNPISRCGHSIRSIYSPLGIDKSQAQKGSYL